MNDKEQTTSKGFWGSLTKTKDLLTKKIATIFGGGKISENFYQEFEEILLSADIGIKATTQILQEVQKKVDIKTLKNIDALKDAIRTSIESLLQTLEKPLIIDTNHKPFVIMVAGINGAGKTTSIGKLAFFFKNQGYSVLLVAGDTFRAAAKEQLNIWGDLGEIVVFESDKKEPATVCFEALNHAKNNNIDIVIIDTAGRLPTQVNLMLEIEKVKKIITKVLENAPQEVLLVLDATIGQNSLSQIRSFNEKIGLTGLMITKIDGSAKGGILCAIAKECPLPIRFVGDGEKIDDIKVFNAHGFASNII